MVVARRMRKEKTGGNSCPLSRKTWGKFLSDKKLSRERLKRDRRDVQDEYGLNIKV